MNVEKNKPSLDDIPVKVIEDIHRLLREYDYDSDGYSNFWVKTFDIEKSSGFIAVVNYDKETFLPMMIMPVFSTPYKGLSFDTGEMMFLAMCIPNELGVKYKLLENTLFIKFLAPAKPIPESEVGSLMHSLFGTAVEVNTNLISIIEYFFPEVVKKEEKDKREFREPSLPHIKLTPKEMKVLYSLLSFCSEEEETLINYLLRQWEKAGLVITATDQSIVLDVPYGDQTTRLGMLLSAVWGKPPHLGLTWGALEKRKGFPKEATTRYRKVIGRLFPLRTTASMGYSTISEIERKDIRVLIGAVGELIESITPETIEPPGISLPITPDNIRQTLEGCSEDTRDIFELLIAGWHATGGTVQCKAPGRIYLRMKTKAHEKGQFARRMRNFNLVVLASPKGKTHALIQTTFGLAKGEYAAYLDCIPEAVYAFEETVSLLPGYEKHGTVDRILLSDEFKVKHAQKLMKSMLLLKIAEENTQ